MAVGVLSLARPTSTVALQTASSMAAFPRFGRRRGTPSHSGKVGYLIIYPVPSLLVLLLFELLSLRCAISLRSALSLFQLNRGIILKGLQSGD